MGRKQLFSLIEIAVAMAVAAIGVAAIMALLPLSVKSTSDAVGDVLAADAANAVIAQLDWAAWEHFEWIQDLPVGKPEDSLAFEVDQKNVDEELGAESYKFKPEEPFQQDGNQRGHFLFFFGPPNERCDFAAEVFCWREANDNVKLTMLGTTVNKTTGQIATKEMDVPFTSAGQPALIRVFIEISWPISKPYGSRTQGYPRQSRLFVREYLAPAFRTAVN